MSWCTTISYSDQQMRNNVQMLHFSDQRNRHIQNKPTCETLITEIAVLNNVSHLHIILQMRNDAQLQYFYVQQNKHIQHKPPCETLITKIHCFAFAAELTENVYEFFV